jgi:methionyl-tRNA synthetase
LSYNLTPDQISKLDQSLKDVGEMVSIPTQGTMLSYDLKSSLDHVFQMLDHLNKYADTTEPWKLIKTDEHTAVQVLYTLAE